jgi:hypothetical protein
MGAIVPVLGVLAGVMSVADTIPYVRDILRGTTRPHRGTWLIWGALAVVVVLSQRADGASWSLIMVVTDAVLTLLILALSVRRGVGGVSRGELLMIAIAGAGVAGWVAADEPWVATAGGALAAVGAFAVSLLIYPVYFCAVNGAIAALIVHRRRVLEAPSHPATGAGLSGAGAPRSAATHPTGGAG